MIRKQRMGKERNSEIEDIHNAARSGDLLKLQSICSSNPLAVNSRDKHSRTPLHLATWAGQTQVVTYLCKHKADVGAAAMDDMGAIHFAAQKGHLEVVRTLLSSGASVKAITRKGMTPLHYAAQGSHLDLAKYLVRKGGSLSAKSKAGKTPLDLAGSEEFRTVLVECERLSRKGDKNVKDKVEESEEPKPSILEKAENSDGKVAADGEGEEHEDTDVKRKADEDSEEHEDTDIKRKADEDGEEQEDTDVKRKADEDGTKEEASKVPKKARVALNHLLSADYTQEDEENM